jgi:FMN phosphatase YigB (HAD superfamily)
MKPHPSIFERALERAGVTAIEALMVGDSFKHDIEGALSAGWRAVLLKRSGDVPYQLPPDLSVITTLAELPALL